MYSVILLEFQAEKKYILAEFKFCSGY